MTDTKLLRPRWATPDDNEALVELVRACPMHGAIEMYFDRGPDYFTLSRLQGTGAKVCVADDGDRLAAAAAVSYYPEAFFDGSVRPLFYACDLRLHPERRKGRLVKRIYDFMTDYGVGEGWDLGFTTVMAGNESMASVLQGKGSLLPYHHVTTMRNLAIQFLLPRRSPGGVEIRPATLGDIPQMVAAWNRIQSGKQFAPVWSEAGFRAMLERSPGLDIANYYLAFREGRMTGLLAAWDQSAFKRMVVLGYSPEMRRMRRWYNPLSRILGLAPMAEVGSAMPYLYAAQPCAETASDLKALLTRLYNDHRGRRHLFISAMVDTRDPLLSAFEGFMTQTVDIELFVMDPLRKWTGHSFSERPAYFDHSLV